MSLSAADIEPLLHTRLFGRDILCFSTLDSTNREARRRADALSSGTVLIADEQTAGRGRFGRQWLSSAGEGLWMSVLFRPEIETSLLTLMAGVAACQALRAQTGLPVGIKWPNDLMINGRKVCGILGEILTGGENTVILGLGINVSQTVFAPELAHTATSLRMQTNRIYDRAPLAAAVLNVLDEAYHDLLKEKGASALVGACSALCITLGQEVRVMRPDGTMTGKADSIAIDGALRVQTDQGLVSVYAGEVSVRDL